ncbi:Endoglucanase-1 [Tolypocladium ophioglossoides CBS 100239]|uniref:Endoglucanase-1 n=1 Tax=Tolypocladium ophioglossoides (strain CBS 100239) TaxID=1163406 RepID=A0A0L0N4Y1_TOLOC|nr:Endoglucanase-1 [Tolypocladium ophioglossoides CBS 100239]
MFRWLVNFGFLALPIAATIGILLGIQSQRQASGQPPLFVPTLDNKVVEATYCQKSFGVHPETKGQQYILNPNQWGWNVGDPGFLCMNVTTFNNQTYATNTTAPEWKIFWQYPQETGDGNNVHAFSNIMVDGGVFPVGLKSVSQIGIDMQWTMRTDNDTGPTDDVALTAAKVNANVAIDMFMDSDKTKAEDSTKATYEVMVWFAAYGDTTHTVGQDLGVVSTLTLNGTAFELYYGQNLAKQNVLTWKATSPTHDFHGDLHPLLDEIFKLQKTGYPSETDYLGYFSFGSEAYFSDKPVTFSVPSLSIDVRTS